MNRIASDDVIAELGLGHEVRKDLMDKDFPGKYGKMDKNSRFRRHRRHK